MRTYRSVADPAGLLPAERDPVTGRRVARRDDKRRRHRRVRRVRRPWLVAGGAAAVVVAATAAIALSTGGDDASSTRARTRRDGTSAPGTGSDGIVAGAISADYRGGRQTVKTCVDPSGAPCTPRAIPWEPLPVRCTADGCTATIFGTTVRLGDAAAAYSTNFVYERPDCGTAPMTGSLRAVGHTTTHGVRRPVRIVGTLRLDATPHAVPGANCLGGVQEYRYDATAS